MRKMFWLKPVRGKYMIEASTGGMTEFWSGNFPVELYKDGDEALFDVYTNDPCSVCDFHREGAGIRLVRKVVTDSVGEYEAFNLQGDGSPVEVSVGRVCFPIGCEFMLQGFPDEFYMRPVHCDGRGNFDTVWKYARARETLFPVRYFKDAALRIVTREGVLERGSEVSFEERYLRAASKVLDQIYGHWVTHPKFEHDVTFRFEHPWDEALQICNVIGHLSVNMFYAGALAAQVPERLAPFGDGKGSFDPLVAFGAQNFKCDIQSIGDEGRRLMLQKHPAEVVDKVLRAVTVEAPGCWLDTRYIDCAASLPEHYRKAYVTNFCTTAFCAGAMLG